MLLKIGLHKKNFIRCLLDDSVLIVFIDYGNSESKQPNEIYPLTESLARLPAMTVACTLHEVGFL